MRDAVSRCSRTFYTLGSWALAAAAVAGTTSCSVDERQVRISRLTPSSDAGPRTGPAGGLALPVQNAPDGGPFNEPNCESSDCSDIENRQSVEPKLCPADNVCQTFDSKCVASFRELARDGAACDCDSGGCTLIVGEACTGPNSCGSEDCRATNSGTNICCAAGCTTQEACTANGTSCEAARDCTEEDNRCSGSAYQSCSEGQWVVAAQCDSLGCDNMRGGCLRSAGQTCVETADCGEGQCAATADSSLVCCTANCAATCQRCSASGNSCENISNDSNCGEVVCPADTTCRAYSSAPSSPSCSENRCATPEERCDFTANNPGQACNVNNLCDDRGNCNVPKRPLGDSCSFGGECQSNACIATVAATGSVCCSRACTANELCNTAGACAPAPVCENGETQCSGSNFQRCVQGQWSTEVACGGAGCSEQRQGCLGSAGDQCISDSDCGGLGVCRDSSVGQVCCTAQCDRACSQCAASGRSCQNLNDDAACGSIDCPSDTTCSNFPAAIVSQRCIAGRCGSPGELCTAAPRAVGQVCSSTSLCDSFGNCSRPKKQLGADCSGNQECSSNFCVDGACCNQDCNGTCETCAITGICRAPADDPVCPQILCGSLSNECVVNSADILTNRCSSQGVCETDAACGFVAARTPCGGAVNGTCDGLGQCRSPSVDCGGFCSVFGVGDGRVCCAFFDGSETSCVDEAACPTPPDTPIFCDDQLDCPVGDVCCLNGNSNVAGISCISSANCAAESSPARFTQQVCGAPGKAQTSCPNGQNCVAAAPTDRLVGWSFCQR